MTPLWSQVKVRAASGVGRSWIVLACPRCASLIQIEVYPSRERGLDDASPIPLDTELHSARSFPEGSHERFKVSHLPEDVERFFTAALRVMEAGVPDAAAVQLRRTIEASANHKEAKGRTLVAMVQSMIDEGIVTRDFAEVLTHVRKLGNIGAHASDEQLTASEVERAMSFTTQFLRNVFEVPGELAALIEEAQADAEKSEEEN